MRAGLDRLTPQARLPRHVVRRLPKLSRGPVVQDGCSRAPRALRVALVEASVMCSTVLIALGIAAILAVLASMIYVASRW